MPIDLDAVGAVGDPVRRSWTSKDALLYAVGVGCGYPDPTTELQFATENSQGIPQQVLPTFATIVGIGAEVMNRAGTFKPGQRVYGEQGIEILRPIPPDGEVEVTGKLAAIYDKGSGAVIVVESSSRETSTGEVAFRTTSSYFVRGEGGFGGDRGPAGGSEIPDRAPDVVVNLETKPDQALIYRLSGDRNPLHSDPHFAKGAGFDRPILHGLCTYGFSGRALLQALCEFDPSRLRSMEGRFSKPVFPGDTLSVSIWVDGSEAVFRTAVDDRVVFDNGRCSFIPS